MMKKGLFFITAILLLGGVFLFNEPSADPSATLSLDETKNENPEPQELNSEPIEDEYEEENNNEESCIENINKLSLEELKLIDGVGEVYAQRILEEESIKTKEDLLEVSGIGEVTSERIKDFVCNLEENLPDEKEKEEKKEVNTNGSAESEVNEVTLSEEELEVVLTAVRASERNLDENVSSQSNDEKTEKVEDGDADNTESNEFIDINESNKEELETISGIGSTYAERIIEKRPFCNPEELLEVSGIGETTLDQIKDQNIKIDCEKDNQIELTNTEEVTGSEDMKEKINDLEKELENALKSKEDVKDQKEDLKEEVDYLESEKRVARNDLSDYRDENRNMQNKLEELKIARDSCRFEKQTNINNAPIQELKEVSGIGDSISKEIKTHVSESPVKHLEDLKSVNGVGEVTINNLINDGFCAEDPVTNGDGDSDNGEDNGEEEGECGEGDCDNGNGDENNGNGNGDEEKQLITFQEENELENTEVKVYEDEDLDNQIGDVLDLDEDGVAEKYLQEGNYWFKAVLQGYESYENNFELDKDKTIKFELEEAENMLKNPYFEGWKDDNLLDWNWEHRGGLKEEDPLIDDLPYFEHEPYSDYRDLTQKLEIDKDSSHKINLWTKGKGRVRVGLKNLEEDEEIWSNHKYKEIDSKDWKKLSFEVDEEIKEAKLIIRITRLEETGESFSLGAVWMGVEPPPKNWPK